jgi:hypothetical protein
MTATTQNSIHPQEVRCEVRSRETDEILGYLVVGGTAACLEQALTENGFSLVPVTKRRSRAARAVAVA